MLWKYFWSLTVHVYQDLIKLVYFPSIVFIVYDFGFVLNDKKCMSHEDNKNVVINFTCA